MFIISSIFVLYGLVMLYGRIPRNINLDGLVHSLRGNKTKKEFIRNGIVYVISKIHNQQLTNSNDNFIQLNHKTLERIIGKGEWDRVGLIKKVLLDNGIIETDGIYHQRVKSFGYRMKEDYLSEDLVRYPYGERISKNILSILPEKNDLNEEQIEIEGDIRYNYLNSQFERHEIRWNDDVYGDIKSIGLGILETYERKRSLKNVSTISLLNYIGYLLIKIKDIENRNYQHGISLSNNRFNTVLTSIPKSLRSYLLINGEQLIDVDIVTSQPYLLSCILNNRFENDEEVGFNLKTIYPILKSYFEISYRIIQGEWLNNYTFFGCNFYEDEIPSIEEYCSLDFTQDFYETVVGFGLEHNVQLTREQVKKSIMNLIFNDTVKQRDNSHVTILLEHRFKGLMSFFEGFFGKYSSRRLALLLQRAESYLILDKVVPKILEHNNDIPVFTIHDCVLTIPEHQQVVSRIMKETIGSITNKPLQVKSKLLVPNRVDLEEQILGNTKSYKMKEGKKVKIRRIKTNVVRGYEFLFPDGNEKVLAIVNQRFPE